MSETVPALAAAVQRLDELSVAVKAALEQTRLALPRDLMSHLRLEEADNLLLRGELSKLKAHIATLQAEREEARKQRNDYRERLDAFGNSLSCLLHAERNRAAP